MYATNRRRANENIICSPMMWISRGLRATLDPRDNSYDGFGLACSYTAGIAGIPVYEQDESVPSYELSLGSYVTPKLQEHPHHWTTENILICLFSNGRIHRIFSLARLLLVAYREYSHLLGSYWSHIENILIGSSSIGRIQRIFSLTRLLLVAYREYSHLLVFYWSHTENILIGLSSIGRIQSIFSFACLLLVAYGEHSYRLIYARPCTFVALCFAFDGACLTFRFA
jgi:hypothetical protein